MFFKKKAKKISFEEKLKVAKYERVYKTLNDILKTDVRTTAKDGKEVIDYAATCSVIKTKARLAIDFIADLDKNGDDNK